VNDQFLVWDELRKDARFGKQTYNIIRILDLKSGKIEDLSKNSRFYSPILSDNSQKVYTVQVDQNNLSSLFYIDRISKKSSKIMDFPEGFLIQQPSLNEEETKISAIAISPKGTNIIEIDLETSQFKELFPWSNQEFQRPIYLENDLIFKAQFQKIDNLYRYSSNDKKLYIISDSPFGAFHPSPGNNHTVLYNEYQFNGKNTALSSRKIQ